jgi:hypothetical protein
MVHAREWMMKFQKNTSNASEIRNTGDQPPRIREAQKSSRGRTRIPPFGSAQTGKRLLEPSLDTEPRDEVQGRRPQAGLTTTQPNRSYLKIKSSHGSNSNPPSGGLTTIQPNRSYLKIKSSRGWTRTSDKVVNSHPLYQLSYAGTLLYS